MSSELADAANILRVTMEGVEMTVKLTGTSLENLVRFLTLIKDLLQQEKRMGKTTVKELIRQGSGLQVLQFDSKELRVVQKLAKKYGILYAALPDLNKADGMSEIMFSAEAAQRVQLIVEKLKNGRLESMEDYINNGDKEVTQKEQKKQELKLGQFDYFAAGNYIIEHPEIKPEAVCGEFKMSAQEMTIIVEGLQEKGLLEVNEETGALSMNVVRKEFSDMFYSDEWEKPIIPGYTIAQEELLRHMPKIIKDDDTRNSITIDRKMFTEETDTKIKTRIPYKRNQYLWLEKADIARINENKTIFTFLEKKKQYPIVDIGNQVIAHMKGDELYSQSYDAVGIQARKRAYGQAKVYGQETQMQDSSPKIQPIQNKPKQGKRR